MIIRYITIALNIDSVTMLAVSDWPAMLMKASL